MVPEIVDIIRRIDAEAPSGSIRICFIIQDNTAHMANLSVYVSSYVNGVAEIHSEILKNELLRGLVLRLPRALPEQDQRHHAPRAGWACATRS